MKNCIDCGHTVSDSAKTCPKCGADLRAWFEKISRGAWAIMLIVLAIIVIKYDNKKSQEKVLQLEQSIPPEEKVFIAGQDALSNIHNILFNYNNQYDSAQNEIQQSNAYRLAMEEIKNEIIKYRGKFENWSGTLMNISTLDKGGKTLTLKIKSSDGKANIIFKTSCSVIGSCGISIENPVYNMVRNLNEGDYVIFSGNFLVDNEGNLSENSFTEYGGMMLPEFEVEFTEIKIQNLNE